MVVLIHGIFLLIGFVLGYFFQTGVLIAISIIGIIAGIVLARTIDGLEGLIAVVYLYGGSEVLLAMWLTWYYVNDMSVCSDIMREYILR